MLGCAVSKNLNGLSIYLVACSLVSKLSYTQHIMVLQISMWDKQMSKLDCRILTSANCNKNYEKYKLSKILMVRGSPGRNPRLPWEPWLTVWEPLHNRIPKMRILYIFHL